MAILAKTMSQELIKIVKKNCSPQSFNFLGFLKQTENGYKEMKTVVAVILSQIKYYFFKISAKM